ncbi:ATP-binding protein [Planobispora rosea]|uniref:ATP-binding protein n=1 Tax=Planobispora rosea TaxID=35762 RepID=UPI00083B3326|nr:ATP-binding protein [Planobispora rosea]
MRTAETVDHCDHEHRCEQLEQERTFLAALLDSLDAGVVACDTDGRLVQINQPMREILRTAEHPDTPHAWASAHGLYAPDGRRLLATEEIPLVRALAGERVAGQQVVMRPPGQSARRLAVNARPITAPDGRQLGAVAVGHDITDAHRTGVLRAVQHAVNGVLAAERGTTETAHAVLGAIAGVLGWRCGEYWQVDADAEVIVRVVSWSEPGRDLSAFTGTQPLAFAPGQGVAGKVWAGGRSIWSADLPDDERGFARIAQARQAGLHAAIGLPMRSGGAGAVMGVLAFYTDQIIGPDDDLIGLLEGVCAQVGQSMERRRADELAHELATTRERFDQVAAQLEDYIWTWEITADGQAHSVYQSPNTAGILGAQVHGTDLAAAFRSRYLHPDDREVYHAFTATLASGQVAQAEYRIIGVDGRTRWVWSRATPRREAGRLLVDGISTDVTDRHTLAEQREHLLRQQQQQVARLRELDAMKDELMAMVSHELRNPIGLIRGYAEMLRDAPDLPGEHRAFIEVIDRTSGRLQELVDDLLQLARLEAGLVTIDARTIGLTGLIRQAVEEHRAAAAAKNLTLTTELAHYLHVHADPVRIRQVLDNLLSNAIKYTPGEGCVTVTAVPACPGSDGLPSSVTLTVADTGIGIPAEQYDQLFSRFFRASTARQAGIEGTGLGLATTKAIIDAHGRTA